VVAHLSLSSIIPLLDVSLNQLILIVTNFYFHASSLTELGQGTYTRHERKECCVDTMPADQAVEALVHEYYKLVFHTIYGLTGNWEESQDLTQDTFVQALKAIDAARATSGIHFHAKAWLLRIALNTVRMQRRRHALFRFIPFSHMHERKRQDTQGTAEARDYSSEAIHEQAAPLQPDGYGATPAKDPAELIAEQEAVYRTLAKLPETLRVCLLLSIIGGLSTAEIAALLDLKEPAVRQRLARARKQFQQEYNYESGEQIIDTIPVASTAAKTLENADRRQMSGDSTQSAKNNHLTPTTYPFSAGRSYA
jgi:RNA polymerase sigma-70 factor (ECF subfamily)